MREYREINYVVEYKQKHAAWIATCAEMLATEKFFFKNYFRADTEENTLAYFGDSFLTGAAKALGLNKQPYKPMRAALGNVCAEVDQVLANLETCGSEEVV